MTWGLPLLFLVGLISISSSFGMTYLTDRCLCQLDPHLFKVKKNLEAGNSYPPTPPPGQTTTMPPNNNNNQDSKTSSENKATSTSEVTTESSTNASDPPTSRRRKRAVETSDGSSSSSDDESSEKGVLIPVVEGIVSYDSTVRLINNDRGVFYSKTYNATLCNCTIGSTVALSFCLLNKKFSDSLTDFKSQVYQYHMNRLLSWIDNIFRTSYIKLLYVRTVPWGFSLFRSDQVMVNFNITLNERREGVDYEIETAFQTKEVKNGKFKIKNELYETDIEYEKGCFKVKDTTPEEPKPEPTLDDTIRYALLGAALGLVLMILVMICCGKWDKFFARFW